MQFRARSLRTALFASALMTAVAVPAAAAQPAPVDNPATNKAVGKAQVVRQVNYNVRTGRLLGMTSNARGRINWTRDGVRNLGLIQDRGRGYSRVVFRLERLRGQSTVRTFFVREGVASTRYQMSGRFHRITITQCKVLARQRSICRTETFRQNWR
jgi:hypothetical protein